jgi:flagellin-specific chaperone FliS
MEPFEVSGELWIPDKPDKKYTSKLSFDLDSGINIKINSLNKFQLSVSYGEKTTIRRKGTNQHIGNVTPLLTPIFINESYFESENATYRLLGCELMGGEVKIAIKCQHLPNTIERQRSKSDDKLAIFKSVSYPEYQIDFHGLNDWVRSYFTENNSCGNMVLLDKPQLSIHKNHNQQVYFKLSKHKKNITLLRATEIIDDLRNFLMSASQNHIILKDIKAVDLENQTYPIYWHNPEMKLPSPVSYKWVFTLSDVANDLPKLISAFCDKKKKLAPLQNNYLRHRYILDEESYFHEVQFLSYVQGLEGFFKRKQYKLPERKISLNEYINTVIPLSEKTLQDLQEIDSRLVEILSREKISELETNLFYMFCIISKAIPSDLRSKFFSCLDKDHKYDTRPLREPLGAICSEMDISSDFAKCIWIFSERITDLRNRLTHEAVHNLDNWDIYYYNSRLEIVILLLIYKEIGLDDKLISQISMDLIQTLSR